jgi:transposase-like protein
VIALVVLWRLRYRLTLRDLAEMFLQRGFAFSHEAVREWEAKLTPVLADDLRRRGKGGAGRRSWHVDETYLRGRGRWCFLYRAIDRNGDLVDTLLSEHRDMAAAKAFFRSAKSVADMTPDRVTTDGHDPTHARSALRWAEACSTGRAASRTTAWSRTTGASKGGSDVCAASGRSTRLRGSVEATTNCATISVPAPATASTYPPAAGASFTSVVSMGHLPFCRPRRTQAPTVSLPCPPWRER